MLNHGILDVFQVLYGVDALPPVFAHVSQRALDVFDVEQSTVQLRQSRANAIQLRLDGCLKDTSAEGDAIATRAQDDYTHTIR